MEDEGRMVGGWKKVGWRMDEGVDGRLDRSLDVAMLMRFEEF